jgi:hypothetical protein
MMQWLKVLRVELKKMKEAEAPLSPHNVRYAFQQASRPSHIHLEVEVRWPPGLPGGVGAPLFKGAYSNELTI